MTRRRAGARIPPVRPLRIIAAAIVLAALPAAASAIRAQGYGGTVSDMLVRGDSLLAQQKANEAIVQYQEARTLCLTPAEMVHALQGEAQGRILGDEPLPAAALLEDAVKRFPADPRAPDMLYQAGLLRYQANEVVGAIDLYRQALDHQPTPDLVPTIKFALAQALRSMARHAEVIDLLKDFATDYPDHPILPTALYMRAITQHDLRHLEESEKIYRDLLKRYEGKQIPQAWVEAHFELAAVLADRGRNREAADYYRKYAALSPVSPYAAAALERAGDLLLFRSPRQSAELYALARVKAAANPQSGIPEMGLSRSLGAKSAVAAALSRTWVVVLAAAVMLALVALLALFGRRLFMKRRRGAATLPGA